MTTHGALWLLAGFLFPCLPASADIVDRIAVSVGNSVITESEIRHQLKVHAFLEGVPLLLDEENKRTAADRLIEQTLIRREIQASRYSPPEPSAAKALLASLKKDRFQQNEANYQAELQRARLSEADLEEAFLWQLTVLRFVEYRFRPGIQIPVEEVWEYYEQKFLPEWKARTNDAPPPFEEVERQCEDVLVQQRIDNLLDRWISLTRTQTSIRYREEVFTDPVPPAKPAPPQQPANPPGAAKPASAPGVK